MEKLIIYGLAIFGAIALTVILASIFLPRDF
jgi:hypothetical protein